MALSMSTTIGQIRDLVATVTGLNSVYVQGDTGGTSLPGALNDLPCAVVMAGPSSRYLLSAGQHRHTYQVLVNVYERSIDRGEAGVSALPFVDRVIEKFTTNVNLGARANHCLFVGQGGYVELSYQGDPSYMGYSIALEVSEQASAAPAGGS